MTKPLVGITMGDAAGVGPEVSLKAAVSPAAGSCRTVIIGSLDVLRETAERIGLAADISACPPGKTPAGGAVNVIDAGGIKLSKLKTGMPSAMCGRASVDYLKAAASLAADGDIDAVATAPIGKRSVSMAGINFPGHTELLEEFCGKKAVMAFVSGKLRVALVSRHIPLARVPGFLNWSRILETVKTLSDSSGDFGLAGPSFALLSVNPHAGDGGVIGSEDERKVFPAVKMIEKLGIKVAGPFPADGYFGSGKHMSYDWTVAMYHDQGLIPYKMASFGKGVNVTVGLPFVRTSADHGTAYDIAGRGLADEGSMVSAVRLAAQITGRRGKGGAHSRG